MCSMSQFNTITFTNNRVYRGYCAKCAALWETAFGNCTEEDVLVAFGLASEETAGLISGPGGARSWLCHILSNLTMLTVLHDNRPIAIIAFFWVCPGELNEFQTHPASQAVFIYLYVLPMPFPLPCLNTWCVKTWRIFGFKFCLNKSTNVPSSFQTWCQWVRWGYVGAASMCQTNPKLFGLRKSRVKMGTAISEDAWLADCGHFYYNI